jgi:hypothetical protein
VSRQNWQGLSSFVLHGRLVVGLEVQLEVEEVEGALLQWVLGVVVGS